MKASSVARVIHKDAYLGLHLSELFAPLSLNTYLPLPFRRSVKHYMLASPRVGRSKLEEVDVQCQETKG